MGTRRTRAAIAKATTTTRTKIQGPPGSNRRTEIRCAIGRVSNYMIPAGLPPSGRVVQRPEEVQKPEHVVSHFRQYSQRQQDSLRATTAHGPKPLSNGDRENRRRPRQINAEVVDQ